MDKFFNTDLFVLARKSVGLTQKSLSSATGIHQPIISKIEKGMMTPNDEMIEKFSEIFDVPISFFADTSDVYPLSFDFYRKYETLEAGVRNIIEAQLCLKEHRLSKILETVTLPELNLPTLNIYNSGTIDDIANFMRSFWKIPRGSIKSMFQLLESVGILIYPVSVATRKFSGITIKTRNGQFIIFINNDEPVDRKRHTLAHETFHILFYDQPTEDREEQADLFASCFLMPKDDISFEFDNLTFARLEGLKLKWKSSMQSLIMRAKHLNKISPEKYTQFWKIISKYRYRFNEPVNLELPEEQPQRMREIFEFLEVEKLLQTGKVFEMFGCNENLFYKEYSLFQSNEMRLYLSK